MVHATVPVVAGGLLHRKGEVAEDSVIDEAPYDTAWIAEQAVDAWGGGSGVGCGRRQ
ncbi:hypothetical protein [Myceligenerans indicum]|uniref:Uncharacterized protein n=1 Tax=Myceligenerans indicum TaxID=2593663 RepID=A0ABS1LIB9_9MICO|nr:hypothetical protein [Myceligenerans indicum]MBL0885889.1 hypothetical protein [Myceligenerans indicum]